MVYVCVCMYVCNLIGQETWLVIFECWIPREKPENMRAVSGVGVGVGVGVSTRR